MRHRMAGRKLGRTTSHRLSMLGNIVTSLFVHERIRTTDAKAKEVRKLADKMITLGKRGDLHARRQVATVVRGREVTRKLFTELADRYRGVPGGYTRIIKLGLRRGDGAMISLVELSKPQEASPGRKRKGTKRAPTRKSAPRTTGQKKKEEPAGKTEEKES